MNNLPGDQIKKAILFKVELNLTMEVFYVFCITKIIPL